MNFINDTGHRFVVTEGHLQPTLSFVTQELYAPSSEVQAPSDAVEQSQMTMYTLVRHQQHVLIPEEVHRLVEMTIRAPIAIFHTAQPFIEATTAILIATYREVEQNTWILYRMQQLSRLRTHCI